MNTKDIAYECDGKALAGYLADGAGGRRVPGILVCHQGMGLTEHARERARMLAELGYVAFALARERFIALMNEAEADWQLLTYGNAGHAFTDRTVDALGMPGFAYHAPTDRRSWAAMRDLFDEALGRM